MSSYQLSLHLGGGVEGGGDDEALLSLFHSSLSVVNILLISISHYLKSGIANADRFLSI